MKRTCLALVLFAPVLAMAAPAFAQEGTSGSSSGSSSGNRGFGVGAAALLTGPIALQFAYDPGAWHAEGLLAFSSNGNGNGFGNNDNSALMAAGRFWYHLHATSASDFSVGGGLGVSNTDRSGPADNLTLIHLDLGVQLRAFIAQNVALSCTAGMGIVTGDNDYDFFRLTAQAVGALGVTYFFN